MIHVTRFVGDDDRDLMMLQNAAYSAAIRFLVDVAWDEWDRAELITSSADAGVPLRGRPDSFDHRTVQGTHDIFAAEFRRAHSSDKPLGDLIDLKADRWMKWFYSEVRDLCKNPLFVRSTCIATKEGHSSIGFAAQQKMQQIVLDRYYTLDQMMREYDSSQHW